MKIYRTIFRAVLMLAALYLLAFGILARYQNWAGSTRWLLAGLCLTVVIFIDVYFSRKYQSR